MNNLLSYCGLVVARISSSEKDLPVPGTRYFILVHNRAFAWYIANLWIIFLFKKMSILLSKFFKSLFVQQGFSTINVFYAIPANEWSLYVQLWRKARVPFPNQFCYSFVPKKEKNLMYFLYINFISLMHQRLKCACPLHNRKPTT